MKKIINYLFVLSLIVTSCESNPGASFYIDNKEPEVGQEVFFNNNSSNSDRFEWDFGDGYISSDRNPSHIFNSTGSFEVKLTAISRNGLDDKAFLTIKVMAPTLLEIEVLEYYTEDPVPDASIILYSSVTDWDAQKNKLIEGFADKYGIAVFSNLDPFVYYVDVSDATHDNYTLRDEDIGFIRTPEILPHKINRFIAWVDVVNHGKGESRGSHDMVIKKLERKVSDKRQPAIVTDTDNWQDLFNRRINK